MIRWGVVVAAAAGACALIGTLLGLPPSPIDLLPAVMAQLPASGVEHPVTAVLLNYRAYDTLLEIAVLMLALLGILALDIDAPPPAPGPVEAMLSLLARLVVPVMAVMAIYLLWAGAHRPGGAFQAAAVLAAGAVMLHLGGLLGSWATPDLRLRWGIVGGFAVFLGVAATSTLHGALLELPPAAAGRLILLIESGLTVSLGLILAGLFLLLSRDRETP